MAAWLRAQQHEVFSVYDEQRGLDDESILRKAHAENWILVTNDKDFGEKVYREHHAHQGVGLLRLADERAVVRIETLRKLLDSHADGLAG